MIEPIHPMLAAPCAAPFDSDEHLFEVKWDGVRALAAVEAGRWRLWGRGLVDYTGRYPELAGLGGLPSGIVLDGELIVLRNRRANFQAILQRHQLTSSRKIRFAGRQRPVTYVLFDLLYEQGRSRMAWPLVDRRRRLAEMLNQCRVARLIYSEGVIGPGRAFFERVVQQGHEGVMAKHLRGRYVPRCRSCAWRKIKPKARPPVENGND